MIYTLYKIIVYLENNIYKNQKVIVHVDTHIHICILEIDHL